MNAAERYAYRVVWSEEDEEFVGTVAELPSLSWLAKTPAEALAGICSLVGEVVADMKASDEPLPLPLSGKKYSGKFQIRIPPELHRQLAYNAAEEHVSLNRLIASRLAC